MNTSRFNYARTARLLLAVLLVPAVLVGCGNADGLSPADRSADAGGSSLADVRRAGVLTVGTEGTYRPFTFHAGGSGKLTGYDVEVARAVAKELGVRARFEQTQWDAIFAGLDAGRFDVIANQVSITAQRKAKYAFSTPYTVSPGVIVVNKGDDGISSFADLAGKQTAQSLTSNWYQLASDSGARVQAVEGWAQAVTLLKQGRVDATINDKLTFLDYRKTENDSGLRVAAQTRGEARNAFAFRKGSTALVAAVNRALAALRANGTLATISEKYFGADVSK